MPTGVHRTTEGTGGPLKPGFGLSGNSDFHERIQCFPSPSSVTTRTDIPTHF